MRQAKKLDIAKGSMTLLPDLQLFSSFDFSGQTVPFSRKGLDGQNMDLGSHDRSGGKRRIFLTAAQVLPIYGRQRPAVTRHRPALRRRKAQRAWRPETQIDAAAQSGSPRLAKKWPAANGMPRRSRQATASFNNQLASRADLNLASMRDILGRVDLLQAQYNLEQAIADLELVNGGSFQ